jgi:RNA polymerase sigma-70 factor, ECF subfamily
MRLRKKENGSELKHQTVELGMREDLRKEIIELYQDFQPRLLCYLCSMHLAIDQAKELIHEAFMRLSTELFDGKKIPNVQGWVVRVTHNLAMDAIEGQARVVINFSLVTTPIMGEAVAPAFSSEEACLRNEQVQQLEIAFSGLRPQQRQCLHMRIAGFRYKDIALALEISEQRAALLVKQALVGLAAPIVLSDCRYTGTRSGFQAPVATGPSN